MISGHFPAQPAPGQRVDLAAGAGMAASVLFVAGFISQGWLHPGYSWTAMVVSELSLGPNGWIQMLNFLLTGALLMVFGRGLRADFRTGAASRAGPILMQCMAVCLMASGLFTTDPSTMPGQTTVHGFVHGVFGALFFTSAPVCCFVFYRRFRTDHHWRSFAGWTLGAGILLVLGIAILRVSQQPGSGLFEFKGLVQRVLLIIIMAWIFAFAFRLRHPRRDRNQAPKALP